MHRTTNEDNIKAWSTFPSNAITTFGDEGDFGRRYLLNPAILQLLGNVQGEQILDAGSGNGYLSRMLAQKGAKVTGVEPASSLFDYAKQRENKEKLGITYLQEDLSKFDSQAEKFESVIANMVFMDIPAYQKAIKNCINALKPGGNFIFSLSHPCFEDIGDEWRDKKQVVVKEYLEEYEITRAYGTSIHRPLSEYVNFILENDCVLKKIIEPKLDSKVLEENPEYERDVHVPTFLIIHATKKQACCA